MTELSHPVAAEIIGNLQVANEIIRRQSVALKQYLGCVGVEGSGLVEEASRDLITETLETLETHLDEMSELIAFPPCRAEVEFELEPEEPAQPETPELLPVPEIPIIEQVEEVAENICSVDIAPLTGQQDFVIPSDAIAAFMGDGHEFHIAQLIKTCFEGKRLERDNYWAVVRYVKSNFGHMVTHAGGGIYVVADGWTAPEAPQPAEVHHPRRSNEELLKEWRSQAHDNGVPMRSLRHKPRRR